MGPEEAEKNWHVRGKSSLTKEQSVDIEGQQVQAFKNILGIGLSANETSAKLDLQELSDRREKAVLQLAKKCSVSNRYSTHIGSVKEQPAGGLGSTIVKHRKDRHFNSPINYATRINQTLH